MEVKKMYCIWKPSQIDAIEFINHHEIAEKVVMVIPENLSPGRGFWIWLKMTHRDYLILRALEPRMTVIS